MPPALETQSRQGLAQGHQHMRSTGLPTFTQCGWEDKMGQPPHIAFDPAIVLQGIDSRAIYAQVE